MIAPSSHRQSNYMLHYESNIFESEAMRYDVDIHCSRCGNPGVMKAKVDIYKDSAPARDDDTRLWCKNCANYSLTCSVCQMPVRGVCFACMICGHGGHTDHMKLWFQENNDCPTGCGCRCGDVSIHLSEKVDYEDEYMGNADFDFDNDTTVADYSDDDDDDSSGSDDS